MLQGKEVVLWQKSHTRSTALPTVSSITATGGSGGAVVVTGGNAGGAGATVSSAKPRSPGPGKVGFIKIYRGNTN